MISGASDKWREEGAQIFFLGLQEAVELDAINIMSDVGSLMLGAGDGSPAQKTASEGGGSKAFVDQKGKPTPLGAWKTNVEAAIAEARLYILHREPILAIGICREHILSHSL